jgi:hypothetical protein
VKRYSLTHLSDEALRRELTVKAASEREATAELLAHIAEFDERRLYLPAAYPSMLAYCIGELGLSEDAAKKRVQVARIARDCPAVFEALASGRVHLTGLGILAPHLEPGTAEELLGAATGMSKSDIERLVAERFPRLPIPSSVQPVVFREPQPCGEGAPAHPAGAQVVANPMSEGAPGHPRARVAPLSAEAFAVQFTRSRERQAMAAATIPATFPRT